MHVSLELPILVKMYSWMSRNRSEYGDRFGSREFWNAGVCCCCYISTEYVHSSTELRINIITYYEYVYYTGYILPGDIRPRLAVAN